MQYQLGCMRLVEPFPLRLNTLSSCRTAFPIRTACSHVMSVCVFLLLALKTPIKRSPKTDGGECEVFL
jgi:hypothetical protein